MNKYLWILISTIALSPIRSENAIPAPTFPVIAKVPAYAAWTEKFTNKAETSATESANGPQTSRALTEIVVTKGPHNRQVIKKWSDGLTTEIWVCQGTVLQEEPGLTSIYISTETSRSASPSSFGADFKNADFPELEWVSLSNYAGPRSYKGKPCYVFQKKESPTASNKGKATDAVEPAGANLPPSAKPSAAADLPISKEATVKTAWIDPETRLPLAMDDGVTLKTYTFQTPPNAEPELSQRFKVALAKYEAAARGPYPISK